MSRPTTPDMLTAINSSLSTINGGLGHNLRKSSTSKAAGGDDVFEFYVMTRIVEALKALTAPSPTVTAWSEKPTGSPLAFKRSPGSIKSTPTPFSYLEFTMSNGNTYEIHISTFVETRCKNVQCEADILILPQATAAGSRGRRASDPSYKAATAFFEVKYWNSELRIKLAREYVGLCHRMRPKGGIDGLVTCTTIKKNAQGLIQGPFGYKCYELVGPRLAGTTRFVSEMSRRLGAVL